VDLSQLTSITSGYAQIRIILRDSNFAFFTGYDDETTPQPINGVAIGDSYNYLGMCEDKIYTNGNYPTVVFYVPFNTPDHKHNIGAYNIGLSNNNVVDTPIFVDPAVTNDG
jgi:hypothetical protein